MVKAELVPLEHVERAILIVRGHRVLLDRDLAALYGVEDKQLKQAVRRNKERFPSDFMLLLSSDEVRALRRRSRSQSVTLNAEPLELIDLSSPARGRLKRGENLKYLPYAFTEQGVAMLSTVLRSARAVQVNIEIMRAFVRLRQMLQDHSELAKKVAALEQRYDGQFRAVFDAIRELMAPPVTPTERIGFRTKVP